MNITSGADIKVPNIYKYIIKYVTPLMLIVIFLGSLFKPLNNDWSGNVSNLMSGNGWSLDNGSIIKTITHAGLHEQIAQCDLIITGEGYLDNESFDGKVVGGVQQLAQQFNKPVVVICGGADVDAQQRIESFSLIENFGESESFSQPLMCVEKAATAIVARFM